MYKKGFRYRVAQKVWKQGKPNLNFRSVGLALNLTVFDSTPYEAMI